MLCPKCKTDGAHRSHRQGWNRFASLFGFVPYRCWKCGHHYLRFRAAERAVSHKPNATEAEIRATRARRNWKRRRREFLLYGWALLLFLVFLYFVTREGGESAGGG